MADRGGNECAIFARSAAVQTGEGLDGLHSIEPFVDIHGVEERLIEACLIFLRDDEHLIRSVANFSVSSDSRMPPFIPTSVNFFSGMSASTTSSEKATRALMSV